MVAYSRKNRRNNRKNSRRNRRTNRRNNRKNNNWAGGYNANEVNDTSMLSPQRLSVAQGNQFADLTKDMHGGMGTYPNSVTGSVLAQPLHASARLVALDRSYDEIKNLHDDFQQGGRRKRRGRKSRKGSRKARKGRKSRRQRGGYPGPLGYDSVSAPGMLLTPEQTARAGLNPEWKLAESPTSFDPK